MNARILVVEDEPSIALGLDDDLRMEGYDVVVVNDGRTAVESALGGDFDLMLLDVMLPGKTGYDVCREVRRGKPHLAILMLTAKSHEAEKVLGLEMGADDYVTKPFSPLELRARIKALLRRAAVHEESVYTFGRLTLDPEKMETRIGDTALDLTMLEFKLLSTLVQNRGRVVSRDRLLDLVWGDGVVVTDRAIDTHISNIRKKLGATEAARVKSVRGLGYRFDG